VRMVCMVRNLLGSGVLMMATGEIGRYRLE
jgi:hypothetical protein